MLTSQDLQLTQDIIRKALKKMLDQPDWDFDKAKELLYLMSKIDILRRQTWNDEKFGVYEEIADEAMKEFTVNNDNEFSSDNIPF